MGTPGWRLKHPPSSLLSPFPLHLPSSLASLLPPPLEAENRKDERGKKEGGRGEGERSMREEGVYRRGKGENKHGGGRTEGGRGGDWSGTRKTGGEGIAGSRREEGEGREERGRRHPTEAAALRENQRKRMSEKAKGERGGRGEKSRYHTEVPLLPHDIVNAHCFPMALMLPVACWFCPAATIIADFWLLLPRGTPAAPRPLLPPTATQRPLLLPRGSYYCCLLLHPHGPLLPCPSCAVLGDPSPHLHVPNLPEMHFCKAPHECWRVANVFVAELKIITNTINYPSIAML